MIYDLDDPYVVIVPHVWVSIITHIWVFTITHV